MGRQEVCTTSTDTSRSEGTMDAYKGWFSEIRVKEGVILDDLEPEIRTALKVLYDLFADIGRDLVVVSTNDGAHSAGSLHYLGQAFDVDTWQDVRARGFDGVAPVAPIRCAVSSGHGIGKSVLSEVHVAQVDLELG